MSREEFDFVSMLSWFHLTVDSDLPIIQDLRAQAASPEERLFKIAQRVGLPAHGLSKSYFDIADSISRILIEIETGIFNIPPQHLHSTRPQGAVVPRKRCRPSSGTGPSSQGAR